MNRLDVLRGDMDDAGRGAGRELENETDACLEILDEFIGEHEVVDALMRRFVGSGRRWDTRVDSPGVDETAQTIIVPRDPEPRITDHTLTERMVVLEDELQHRCGTLGRRVYNLERKLGVAFGDMPVSKPLLEAAEALDAAIGQLANMTGLNAVTAWQDITRARAALAAVIKEERER